MWSTCDRMNGNWTIFDKLISYFAAPLHRGHKFVTAVDSVSIIIGEAGFGGVSWCVCWRISYLLIPRIFNRELNLPRKEEKKTSISNKIFTSSFENILLFKASTLPYRFGSAPRCTIEGWTLLAARKTILRIYRRLPSCHLVGLCARVNSAWNVEQFWSWTRTGVIRAPIWNNLFHSCPLWRIFSAAGDKDNYLLNVYEIQIMKKSNHIVRSTALPWRAL